MNSITLTSIQSFGSGFEFPLFASDLTDHSSDLLMALPCTMLRFYNWVRIGDLQRQKNPVGASALPTGKFLRVRKVFAHIYKIDPKIKSKHCIHLESFRTVWKFPDSLESFLTVWKVS